MEKEFIPYEQALALKELGFDEPCFGTWDRPDKLWIGHVLGIDYTPDNTVLAPTYSQSFRWFREKYGLTGWVSFAGFYNIISKDIHIVNQVLSGIHEEAELECLKKLIEIVKEK